MHEWIGCLLITLESVLCRLKIVGDGHPATKLQSQLLEIVLHQVVSLGFFFQKSGKYLFELKQHRPCDTGLDENRGDVK